MKRSFETGFSFGLTSGTITTLGLMIGLDVGTGSKLAVIGGILTIAFADALSDAMGIHMSEESRKGVSEKSVWESTVATFLAKFGFALTFLIPVLLFDLSTAIPVSAVYGLALLAVLSYHIAGIKKESVKKVMFESLSLGVLVIIGTSIVGTIVKTVFG